MGHDIPSALPAFHVNWEPLIYPSFCRLAAKGQPDALRCEAYFPVMCPWPSQPGTGHLETAIVSFYSALNCKCKTVIMKRPSLKSLVAVSIYNKNENFIGGSYLIGSWSSLSSLLCGIFIPLFRARGHPDKLRTYTRLHTPHSTSPLYLH